MIHIVSGIFLVKYGREITVNGRPILPTVSTTFVFVAEFDPLEYGADLLITDMAFEEVTVNVRAIYDGILAPIFDPKLGY